MDYELRLVPAAQSVNAGSTTSFDIYFTNNTQNALSYLTVNIATNRPILGNNPEQEGEAIYSELNAISYVSGSQAVCTSIINDPEYGNYIDLTIYKEEGGPDITIPSGKIATVTLDIPNDMQSPLNFTFGIELEGTLYYGASAIVGSHDDFSFDVTNTSVTNPQSIVINTVKLGPIANLRKSYDYVEDAYDTIETKGGTIPTDKNLANLSDAINSISGGGGVRANEDDDVLFIDYDGSIVCSYSAEDFLQLTALPANPTHEGLISQGWNWNLSDAKQYVTNHGMIDIGQMYATASGATEFDIQVNKVTDKTITLYFDSYTTATIDWGDNTIDTIDNSEMSHTYVNDGEYTIKVSGNYTFRMIPFGSDSDQSCFCIGARLPNGITTLPIGFFYNNIALKYITLSSSLTSLSAFAFGLCMNLKCLIVPNGVTQFNYETSGSYYPPTNRMYSLERISLPNGINNIGQSAFEKTISLKRFCMPDSVNNIPASAGSRSATFGDMLSLSRLSISNNLTTVNDYTFCGGEYDNNYHFIKELDLTHVLSIDMSKNFATETTQFLKRAEILNLGNTYTVWESNKLTDTQALKKVIFGSNTVSIGRNCFQECTRLEVLDFRNCVNIPTIDSNIIDSVNSDSKIKNLKIIVPDALYDQWIVATNWVNIANYIYKASEV